jgi:hypothetical protein
MTKLTIDTESLLNHAKVMERIAEDTEKNLPNKWLHPLRYQFVYGRICCLKEQAANLRDLVEWESWPREK